MNGDQILASRKKDKEHFWESKVAEFNTEMRKTYSSNYVKSMTGAIRSFFQFHYLPLVFRRQVSRNLTEASRKTHDYKFTKAELAKMAKVGDLTDQYILCVGKSFGLRAIDFIALRRCDLEPYIDREVPIAIGEINTIKEHVKAFPFIDSDAQPVIKLMLEKMNAEGRTNPEDKILTFDKDMLSTHLQKLAQKIGIGNNGKRVVFHCLRKFLIDRLKNVMSESAWKQIVGKAIPESAYVSELGLREAYKRAMPETCFGSNGYNGDRLKALEEENQTQKETIKSLTLQIDALTKFQKQLLEKLHASGLLPKDFTITDVTGQIEATLTPIQREFLAKKPTEEKT